MTMELSNGIMVNFLKAIGKTAWKMVMGNGNLLRATTTMEIGLIIGKRAKESLSIDSVLIGECSSTFWRKERGPKSLQMAILIKDNIKKENQMEKAYIHGQKEVHMKDILSMGEEMDTENWSKIA